MPLRDASRPESGDAALRGVLPVEVEFLAGVLPDTTLWHAAEESERIGVTAETVLLAEGAISSERYYRALARHCALSYAELPVRPAALDATGDVLRTGLVALRANPQGWRYLAAPRGEALRRFLRLLAEVPVQPVPVAITTPERLEALIRHSRRHEVLKTASDGLPQWNHALSARAGVTLRQAAFLLAGATVFCAGAWCAPKLASDILMALFIAAFLLVVTLRLLATAVSPPGTAFRHERASDLELPIYSVIVPLFREAKVVTRLVSALDRLDYPPAKLEILVVVEASDKATLDAIEKLALPARYRVIVAPPGHPRTKPRALNIALQFARGDLVVIFDAEDEPEVGQLRAAVAAFAAEPSIACLQARLAIDNFGDGWLSALFAVEYAALFHVVNPGLARLGLPIPLGGTSNHFRTDILRRLNGWDAWNVTEDIDLGIRLARFGHRVGSLDSTTFEEAPNALEPWLKQRRRWMKGWMVTLGTHSRALGRLWRDLGTLSTLAVLAMLFGTITSCLIGPFCAVMLLLRAGTGNLFWVQSSADLWWNGASLALVCLGAASAVWPALLGLRRRRLLDLAGFLALYPFYLVLLCVASWQALFEVFGRPHVWAKTEHGRARQRTGSHLPG